MTADAPALIAECRALAESAARPDPPVVPVSVCVDWAPDRVHRRLALRCETGGLYADLDPARCRELADGLVGPPPRRPILPSSN